jgi:hypothetical protein
MVSLNLGRMTRKWPRTDRRSLSGAPASGIGSYLIGQGASPGALPLWRPPTTEGTGMTLPSSQPSHSFLLLPWLISVAVLLLCRSAQRPIATIPPYPVKLFVSSLSSDSLIRRPLFSLLYEQFTLPSSFFLESPMTMTLTETALLLSRH